MLPCRKCHAKCEPSELHSICSKSENHEIWCNSCIIAALGIKSTVEVICRLCKSTSILQGDVAQVVEKHQTYTYMDGEIHGKAIEKRFKVKIDDCTYEDRNSVSDYDRGRIHGRYIEYDDFGNKIIDAHYQYGVLHGICKKYAKSNVIASMGEYVEGKLHGIQSYYRNGKIDHEITYKDGVKDGAYTYYCPITGAISRIDQYKDDQMVESITYYISHRTKESQASYKDGKLHGFMIKYDKEENVISSIEYKDGLPYNGKYIRMEGQERVEEFYKDGMIEGTTYVYLGKTDHMIRKIPYVDGKITGIVEEYDMYGNILSSTEYKDGKMNGERHEYVYKRALQSFSLVGKPKEETRKEEIFMDFEERAKMIHDSVEYCDKHDHLFSTKRGMGSYAYINELSYDALSQLDEQFKTNEAENACMMDANGVDLFLQRKLESKNL